MAIQNMRLASRTEVHYRALLVRTELTFADRHIRSRAIYVHIHVSTERRGGSLRAALTGWPRIQGSSYPNRHGCRSPVELECRRVGSHDGEVEREDFHMLRGLRCYAH